MNHYIIHRGHVKQQLVSQLITDAVAHELMHYVRHLTLRQFLDDVVFAGRDTYIFRRRFLAHPRRSALYVACFESGMEVVGSLALRFLDSFIDMDDIGGHAMEKTLVSLAGLAQK